jgi:hypothetical protein
MGYFIWSTIIIFLQGNIQSLLGALRFVFRRPVLTLGLYDLLGITGWATFAVWSGLSSALPMTTVGAV